MIGSEAICVVCEQRFTQSYVRGPSDTTCSWMCSDVMKRRHARHLELIAWGSPDSETTGGPHRISEALRETRAAVLAMLERGRRLRRNEGGRT